MDNTDQTPATKESVWAEFREIARRQKETDRQIKQAAANFDLELAKSSAEFRQLMAESNAEFDRRMAEWNENFEKSKTDYERRQKKMEKDIGAWSNNHGDFAEEYFFNSFKNGNRNFFGETFDRIEKNLQGGGLTEFKDEYDILLINGKSVGLVEIKFKAHYDHIPKVIRKAQTFRINFPAYAGHRVYLALASLNFTADVEKDVKKNGIAVIKQVGDTIFISGDNLKAF